MTDFTSTNKKRNSEAMTQIIQSLNVVLYGDFAAYGKCVQVLEDMEQKLHENKKALSTLKDQLDSKTTHLERTEKNLGESLKTIVDATHEFGRTNAKLLKMNDDMAAIHTGVIRGVKSFDSLYKCLLEYLSGKGQEMFNQFGLTQESINNTMNGMPEQSIGLAKLVLELEKCRTQCMEKEGECSVGEKARKEIASLGADFRRARNSLETHSVCLDEYLSCLAMEIWLDDFDGYFEEEKKNSGEETSVDQPRNGEC